MKRRVVYLLLMLFTLSGCIEPYNGKTDSIDSILVVEGIITSGTTQIVLSKSIGLDESIYDVLAVDHAIVYVECEDGSSSAKAISFGSGIYTIETGELNVDSKYRLVIHLDDEEYHSSYLAPAVSPPVDVTFTSDNSNIHVCVTTHGNDRQPGYYLWSYKEDWEIHAIMFNDSVVIDGKLVTNNLNTSRNHYYCWRRDSSKVLILGTTEKSIESTIRERKIKTFARTDDRSSVLYRVNVKQNMIHKEGYDFYYNLQKNIEQTGSIFGPIPSEIMGNIRCTSNFDIPVIGYIDVSTTSTDEQYLNTVYYDWALASNLRRGCETDTFTWKLGDPEPVLGCGYIKYIPLMKYRVYISERCVDCTNIGGTKKKPKDWPNNHL